MASSGTLHIFNAVINEAVQRKAADILFAVGSQPALKVDGHLERLTKHAILDDADLEGIRRAIVSTEKAKFLESDRQLDLAYATGEARFRVNIFYQRGHLSIVMRYVRDKVSTIDELGLPALMKELVGNDNGLILMVGPTGSGKSTSLAAMIQEINLTSDKHIITIEDPIEYVYVSEKSLIQQRELGSDAIGFAQALRSALREAPDVILLGEMRDLESISTAITVAETGHLVLSTIHANSAPGSIDRIIDIFPEGNKAQIRIQLADILRGVFNQRLVPKADGTGSIAIVEVMLANSAVRNSIRSGTTTQLTTIMQTASSEGMFLLDDLLARAVHRGEITRESALEYASDRVDMQKKLSGS